jgi:hypothetical protein
MVDIELIRFALFQIKRAKKDPAKALRFSEVDALFVVRQAKKKGLPVLFCEETSTLSAQTSDRSGCERNVF